MYYAVFDIGGTGVKHALMTCSAEILTSGSFPSPKDNIENLVNKLTAVVDEYKQQKALAGIALSVPCATNPVKRHVSRNGALYYLDGSNLYDMLHARTGLPIELENDGNCAALAEGFKGSAVDCNYYVALVLGTGLGGSVVINKRIIHGKNNHGGEIGSAIIDNPLQEPIGATISSKASIGGLITNTAAALGVCPSTLTGKDIYKMAEEGKEIAQKEIQKFYRYLAVVAFNIQYTLDPEKILVGGAVSQNPKLFEEVNRILASMKAQRHFLDISIEPCFFYEKANLVGALCNFLDRAG